MSIVLRLRQPASLLTASLLAAAAVLTGSGGMAVAAPAEGRPSAVLAEAAPAAAAPLAAKPYLGWSSWSMQSSKRPGLNPKGDYSWLHEANVLKQADAVAAKLKPYGYEYINMDAGWWRTWDWKPQFDEHGRAKADAQKFPRGMKYVADYIHRKGLKAGIYLPVGLEKEAYDVGGDFTVAGAPECRAHDLVYPDKRTTNGWDSSYKLDFSKPCAQKYIDSVAKLFADWGYDFFKLDGVGPGSFKDGPNYDNRPDVAAWSAALKKTGRPIHFELSWKLDIGAADTWKKNSQGWRINTDVECYCDTLVQWDNSVKQRWAETPAWISHAGPGGWNDLDSLDVGNGEVDGLTEAERQSYMTLWAISASPLYTGDDVSKLDKFGQSLLTHRDVLAINQQGKPARPVNTKGKQQVWRVRNNDGSYTVALFNLASQDKVVSTDWAEIGFGGSASVRDVWKRKDLGKMRGPFSATLPAHGSMLLRVTPQDKVTTLEAEAGTLSGTASVGDCTTCSGGKKVGNLDKTSFLRFLGVKADNAGERQLTINYVDGSDGRLTHVSINGGNATVVRVDGGADDNWNRAQGVTIKVKLKAGDNTITLTAPDGYAPDLDSVSITGATRR